MKQRSTKLPDWTPVRRGEIFCSPACGAGCTVASYRRATITARKMCLQLGPGWQPRVWENMGWFCEATRGGGSVRQDSRREFSAEVKCGVMRGPYPSAASTALQFWGYGTTARQAVDAAISSARKTALSIAATLVGVAS